MTRKPANEMTPLTTDAGEAADPAVAPTPAAAVENSTETGDVSGAPEPNAAHKASVARAAKAREDRLAAALRTNLSRRKVAAKASRESE